MTREQRRTIGALAVVAVTCMLSSTSAPAVEVYAHIVNLSTVSGSAGNGTLFSGSVCRIGLDNVSGCLPGYGNNISQVAFKSYPITGNPHLTYRYRSDCEPGSDETSVVLVTSGVCPVLQPSGAYAFTSASNQRVTLATFAGAVEGIDDVDLSVYSGQTVCVVMYSTSDATLSDADCGYHSADGIFEFDNVQVGSSLTTFDSGANGWTFGALGSVETPPMSLPGVSPVSLTVIIAAIGLSAMWLLRKNTLGVDA